MRAGPSLASHSRRTLPFPLCLPSRPLLRQERACKTPAVVPAPAAIEPDRHGTVSELDFRALCQRLTRDACAMLCSYSKIEKVGECDLGLAKCANLNKMFVAIRRRCANPMWSRTNGGNQLFMSALSAHPIALAYHVCNC